MQPIRQVNLTSNLDSKYSPQPLLESKPTWKTADLQQRSKVRQDDFKMIENVEMFSSTSDMPSPTDLKIIDKMRCTTQKCL